MEDVSRRTLLRAAAAGGVVVAANGLVPSQRAAASGPGPAPVFGLFAGDSGTAFYVAPVDGSGQAQSVQSRPAAVGSALYASGLDDQSRVVVTRVTSGGAEMVAVGSAGFAGTDLVTTEIAAAADGSRSWVLAHVRQWHDTAKEGSVWRSTHAVGDALFSADHSTGRVARVDLGNAATSRMLCDPTGERVCVFREFSDGSAEAVIATPTASGVESRTSALPAGGSVVGARFDVKTGAVSAAVAAGDVVTVASNGAVTAETVFDLVDGAGATVCWLDGGGILVHRRGDGELRMQGSRGGVIRSARPDKAADPRTAARMTRSVLILPDGSTALVASASPGSAGVIKVRLSDFASTDHLLPGIRLTDMLPAPDGGAVLFSATDGVLANVGPDGRVTRAGAAPAGLLELIGRDL
jgi:hypothetical protein